MAKILKWVAIIAILLFAAFKFMQYRTKQASPETSAELKKDNLTIFVKYCQPSKKGREIFGPEGSESLEKFGKVWRTGANEATTFETNQDLQVGGKTLPKGVYTLWTIPDANEWTVIFNSKQYPWGVSFGAKASREAEFDVAEVKVPVQALTETVEKFTISLDAASGPATMSLAWDKTKVTVPLQ